VNTLHLHGYETAQVVKEAPEGAMPVGQWTSWRAGCPSYHAEYELYQVGGEMYAVRKEGDWNG